MEGSQVRRERLQELRQQRRDLRATYPQFYEDVLRILHHHDPIRIGRETQDEYDPEAGTIISRLITEARTSEDAYRIVFEEFVAWFDSTALRAEHVYPKLAADLWDAWKRYSQSEGKE